MISRIDIEDMTDTQDEARKTVKPDYPVKPLDLSNLIRFAILHGRGYRCAPDTRKQVHRLTEDDQAAIMSFDPEGLPCFDRLDNLVAAARKGHLARPSQAGDERVAREAGRAEGWAEAAGFLETLKGADLDGNEFDLPADEWRVAVLMGVRACADKLAALAAMDTPKGGGDE